VSAGQRVRERRARRVELPALATVCAGIALLVGAAGCGERSEPTGLSSDLYPVTITTGETPVVVTRPAQRIAVLSSDLVRLLKALGAGSRVVGTPVAENGKIRLEELRALHPDIVVASASSTGSQQIARAAAAAKAQVYIASDSSLRGIERTITELGLITDTSVAGRRLVRAIEAKRQLAARRLQGVKPVTVFVDTGFFTTIPDESLAAELVREAHGTTLGASDDGGPGSVDVAELLRLDPSVYLATSESGTTLAGLRKNRRLRKLSAIKNGRFAIVDDALIKPGPEVGDGLLVIARALHPDAFR
jgi:iron complex transport system substrate-binding protein